jgi:hypothetical protein
MMAIIDRQFYQFDGCMPPHLMKYGTSMRTLFMTSRINLKKLEIK